jgi:hypothetical protein
MPDTGRRTELTASEAKGNSIEAWGVVTVFRPVDKFAGE